jgi:hypothetical protein
MRHFCTSLFPLQVGCNLLYHWSIVCSSNLASLSGVHTVLSSCLYIFAGPNATVLWLQEKLHCRVV